MHGRHGPDEPTRSGRETLLGGSTTTRRIAAAPWNCRRSSAPTVYCATGRGGMGVVLLARCAPQTRHCIKLLPPGEVRQRLLTEAHARGDEPPHRHDPHARRMGPASSSPWSWLKEVRCTRTRGRPAPAPGDALLVRQMRGLEAAHEGVIHRDLKPANVMLIPTALPRCWISVSRCSFDPAATKRPRPGSVRSRARRIHEPEQCAANGRRAPTWAVGCPTSVQRPAAHRGSHARRALPGNADPRPRRRKHLRHRCA